MGQHFIFVLENVEHFIHASQLKHRVGRRLQSENDQLTGTSHCFQTHDECTETPSVDKLDFRKIQSDAIITDETNSEIWPLKVPELCTSKRFSRSFTTHALSCFMSSINS